MLLNYFCCRSKWRVTHDEYSERWYPPYCMGWVILYSPDTALALSNEALKEPYFWIDDVHITGNIIYNYSCFLTVKMENA